MISRNNSNGNTYIAMALALFASATLPGCQPDKKDAGSTVAPISSPAEPPSNPATTQNVATQEKEASSPGAQNSNTAPQISLSRPEGITPEVYKQYQDVTNIALTLILDPRVDSGLATSLAGEKISINPVLSIVEQAKELKAIFAEQIKKGALAGNSNYYEKIIAGQIITDSLLMTLGTETDTTGKHFIFIESGTYEKGLAFVMAALNNELQHIRILNDPTLKDMPINKREVIAFQRSIKFLEDTRAFLELQIKTSENPPIEKIIRDLGSVINEDRIKLKSWEDAVRNETGSQK